MDDKNIRTKQENNKLKEEQTKDDKIKHYNHFYTRNNKVNKDNKNNIYIYIIYKCINIYIYIYI